MRKNCPLCTEKNQCEAELSTCWCMQITLPEEVKKELQKVNIDEGCVCKACLQRLSKGADLSTIFNTYAQTVDK